MTYEKAKELGLKAGDKVFYHGVNDEHKGKIVTIVSIRDDRIEFFIELDFRDRGSWWTTDNKYLEPVNTGLQLTFGIE